MISIPITKALNPVYRKDKPLRKDIENFKKEFLRYGSKQIPLCLNRRISSRNYLFKSR